MKDNIKSAMPDDTFPMRINKYLAHKGYATRAGADELVSAGKVTINGRRAVLGDKILSTDTVLVNAKNLNKDLVYLAYNKPVGIVTTNPVRGEKQIMDNPTLPKVTPPLFPVGRLDKNSYGLVLLTNDGRVTDRLLNPKNDHEKEYVVEVAHAYSPAFVRHMQDGVNIGGNGDSYMTKPAKVVKTTATKFRITLSEGKNRQIRRMTEKLGYTVTDLCRLRIQNLSLGKLGSGSWQALTDEEKSTFLKSIGL